MEGFEKRDLEVDFQDVIVLGVGFIFTFIFVYFAKQEWLGFEKVLCVFL